MRKSILRLIRGSQRGFTLIELLAVMAVIGVLAGIVTTSVSGTGETSSIAQARSDASTVASSAATYFTDQSATEVLTPKTVTVTALIAVTAPTTGAATFDTAAAFSQEKSSKWPEVFLTENSDTVTNANTSTQACVASVYCDELPTTGLKTSGVVVQVIVLDSDAAVITRSTLLTTYTAVDFSKLSLTTGEYVATAPDSATQTAVVTVEGRTVKAHNYLWTFRKSTSAGGSATNDSRSVTVFKLASAKITEVTGSANDTLTLSYAQIY